MGGPHPLASEFGSGPLMSKMPHFLQSRNLNPHSKPRCALRRCSKVSPVLLNWFEDCGGLVAIYRKYITVRSKSATHTFIRETALSHAQTLSISMVCGFERAF
jgi:hypothetical protein